MNQETIYYKDWVFTNQPLQLTKEDYLGFIKHFISTLSRIKNISVYLDGSFKAPGFSDVDFIIITNKVTDELKHLFDQDFLYKKQKYILQHEPLFLSPSLAKKFGNIIGIKGSDWRHVCGKTIELSQPTEHSLDFRLLDDLVANNLKNLQEMYFTKKVDLRYAANKLYALKYIFPKHIKKKLSPEFRKKVNKFCSEAQDIRKYWFNNNIDHNINLIIKYLEKSQKIIDEYIIFLRGYYLKKYFKQKLDTTHLFSEIYAPIVFSEQKSYTSLSRKVYDNCKINVAYMPPEFISLFSEYRKSKGLVSKQLKRNTKKIPTNIKNEYAKHIRERIKFYNEQAKYCYDNCLGYGPIVSFNSHYRPKKLKSRLVVPVKRKIQTLKTKKILGKLKNNCEQNKKK